MNGLATVEVVNHQIEPNISKPIHQKRHRCHLLRRRRERRDAPQGEAIRHALASRPDIIAAKAAESLAQAQIEQARVEGKVDADVADPFIGGRWSVGFRDDLAWLFSGDVGGFGAGTKRTWQIVSMLRYRLPRGPRSRR